MEHTSIILTGIMLFLNIIAIVIGAVKIGAKMGEFGEKVESVDKRLTLYEAAHDKNCPVRNGKMEKFTNQLHQIELHIARTDGHNEAEPET